MIKYRREIDGLRALAVVPVILFHAGFGFFGGGFIGVDVFFVISGYLISSIILSEKETNTFTLTGFYERRARRILPALFLVIFISLPFAWAWFLPNEMHVFSESLVATPLFSSNILFFLTSGYFSPATELMPLIHTWSLAVEEQYYLIFPLFIVLTWRLGIRWICFFLASLTILSLGLAQWGSTRYPTFTFFLLPTRGWEILIGALLAFYLFKSNTKFNIRLREISSGIGILLIIYSIIFFDKHTPYPSLYTLIPITGATLIILFCTQKTIVGGLLASRPFVGIGIISYSAYLWHQPLLAFARVRNLEELNTFLLFTIIIITFLLAYLSWRFVETPFRNKMFFSGKQIFFYSFISSGILLGIGSWGFITGFEFRFPYEAKIYTEKIDYKWYGFVRNNKCHLQSYDLFQHDATCLENKRPLIALWGDSHASSLYPGLRKLQIEEENFGIIQLTAAGCAPIFDIPFPERANCNAVNQINLKELVEKNPDILILHARWGSYFLKVSQLKSSLKSTLDVIRQKLPNTKIIVVGPSPSWAISPQNTSYFYWKNLSNKKMQLPTFLKANKFTKLDEDLRLITTSLDIKYISLSAELCNQNGCIARVGELPEDFIMIDYGHFSKSGSEYIMKKIKNNILP